MNNYETVIGLEVHVQIKTQSKLFCACPVQFAAPPNSQICPVCAGYPGSLPAPNRKAVEYLVRTALALDCQINERSVFARKQYFYPDLPKNYQISQYELPLAEKGFLEIKLNNDSKLKNIGITRIHLEEDAGKLIHTPLNGTLVDLNRTGIPLMEIVSEPDLRSPEEAHAYLSHLKRILEYLEVSDCDMEKGSLRCDANVSIREPGTTALGTKVELKNMNSLRNVQEAIRYEAHRQSLAIAAGEQIRQETRLWDQDNSLTRPMRSKEQAHDYRYFPDPDLLPVVITNQEIASIKSSLPELPAARHNRLQADYQLSSYDAEVLTQDKMLAEYFERACAILSKTYDKATSAKSLSNWLTSELLGRLNNQGKTIRESPVKEPALAELVGLILSNAISGKSAKSVFDEMWSSGKSAGVVVQEKGWGQVSDSELIETWVLEAIRQNPKAAEEARNGKERALGALVGIVMKLSRGRANPTLVNSLLNKKVLNKG